MIFGSLILATALMLSAIAAFYSIVGLVAIFSAMPIPIIIMGGSLEIAKIVTTVFLHNNWKRLSILYKMYLVPAVVTLMLLTSLGIFGLLSKAHSDQSLISGDSLARVAIFDEKIRTAKDNIDVNRKALKQMDEAVDQVMGRSTSETGADKAVAIRRAQAKERVRLQSEIASEQKVIAALGQEAAPLRAEFRKVESEVGPIKYIAALIYGDNPDSNLLERAVRWMIILIVLVFDPLALTLILAANKQFEWARQGTGGFVHDSPPDNPVEPHTLHTPHNLADKEVPADEIVVEDRLSPQEDTRAWHERYPYLTWPFVHFKNLNLMPSPTAATDDRAVIASGLPKELPVIKTDSWSQEEIDAPDAGVTESEKLAIKAWKAVNLDDTIKAQRTKLARGHIDRLPWADPKYTQTSFGNEFPAAPDRGDTFVKTDRMPSQLYKFNGNGWIIINKNSTDNYTYDIAYIDHLIEKISTGEYDPDLLSDIEREHVAERLKQHNTNA